jgi:hypothetical protein
MKRIGTCLMALLLFVVIATPARGAGFENFGFAEVSAELSTNQAGGHPDFTTRFEMASDPSGPVDPTGLRLPYGHLDRIGVDLPAGLLSNLNAVDTCLAAQFVTAAVPGAIGCPFSSQVGIAVVRVWGNNSALTVPVYKLEASGGDEVARLGFYVVSVPAFIDARVRSEGDYGVSAVSTGISTASPLSSVKTTLWGVPGASVHNSERLTVEESLNGKSASPNRSSGRAPEPFMLNPTTCGQQLEVSFEAESYEQPGVSDHADASLGAIEGCSKLSFEPSFELTPTSREAGVPAGADAILTIPQNEAVNGLATSQLRSTMVRLPRGVTIATGAADGLEACSAAQVGYGVSPPPPAACPAASKIATAEIDSPSLPRPIEGAVYQRTPEPGHLTRAWLVADELGVHVKLPGEFALDPDSGQITALFLETPQVPVRQFRLHFKSGARGVLATPDSCGTYQTEYQFSPWSGGAVAAGLAPMSFDQRCGLNGFAPKLAAGTESPAAGEFSPFLTDLVQAAGEQNLAGLSLTFPPGVLAKLAGVGVCSDAAAASGDCPASSQIGSASVATGPGPSPLWIPQPGRPPTAVYLAGPYHGGPYSLVVKTLAQAGPFDLGIVVVRAAVQVDPETAQVSVSSDPLPQFLQGIPVDYRTVHVQIDRPDFALNPTNCDPARTSGTATSALGATAALSSRFQAGGCAGLGFEPKLSLKLSGSTRRTGNPALKATLTMPKSGANIARAQVALPHSEFLDNSHIRTICTRVQFAADQCPAGSVYGHARAFTPLLGAPLEGPLYLRSSNHKLPDLVADLRGQVDIVLVGRIDSVNGGIRTTFEALPDAAVSKFVLSMQGGKKGLLTNSESLCGSVHRARAKFDGQNGKVHDFSPVLKASCGKDGRRK